MTATILITGASGLIGFRILVAALEAGHNVRYVVRSEEKAKIVASNPAVLKLRATGDRLVPVVIPDFTVEGAFDAALDGVTHIIHTGSPVPMPHFDPKTEVFDPTVKIAAGILQSALKSPTVQHVVITSSIVANLPPPTEPQTGVTSGSTRVPLPNPLPETFNDPMEAYVLAKQAELHNTDTFAATQAPHFAISHIMPGYVFGRNDLVLNATMMQTQNTSNNYLMVGLVGGVLPFPIHGVFAHVDDVAQLHLRVALEEAAAAKKDEGRAGRDVGIAVKVDYATIFKQIEDRFPEAVAAGVLKRGEVPTLPTGYDSSEAEALLGGKLRTFGSAVADVAGQYLEVLAGEGR